MGCSLRVAADHTLVRYSRPNRAALVTALGRLTTVEACLCLPMADRLLPYVRNSLPIGQPHSFWSTSRNRMLLLASLSRW
jgi:hypothetical protein